MKQFLLWLSFVFLAGCPSGEHTNARAKHASTKPAPSSSAGIATGIVSGELASRWKIELATVKHQALTRDLELPGTVEFDQDQLAIVGPRLGGRVLKISARLGDQVKAGQVLAELDSVELARASAEYLGVTARAEAAASNARRELDLAERNISSERERETSQAEAAALAAQARAAEHLLMALGLSHEDIPKGNDYPLNRYRLRSPISGLVVERNGVVGEAVDSKHTMYRVASLSRVWIKLNVYERDLSWVQPGLLAELRTEGKGALGQAKVAYIEPAIDEASRTARVHLNFDNSKAHLRPGQFVTARLHSEGSGIDVLGIPKAAVETVEGKSLVFVKYPDGSFHVREVKLGSSGAGAIEVRAGLVEGEQIAVSNVFLLKSEVLR